MRRTSVGAAVCLLAAFVVVGCGGDPARTPARTADASSTAAGGATPSPNRVPAGGRVDIVRADDATSPSGGCTPRRDVGLVCSADGSEAYRFQPGQVQAVRVADARVVRGDTLPWAVDLRLDRVGAASLEGVTTRAAESRELVLLLLPGDGTVLLAANATAPVRDGRVQISGGLSRSDARRVVRRITSSGR